MEHATHATCGMQRVTYYNVVPSGSHAAPIRVRYNSMGAQCIKCETTFTMFNRRQSGIEVLP
jgi:type IV pilus biogenesis protein CpaD/CtpE